MRKLSQAELKVLRSVPKGWTCEDGRVVCNWVPAYGFPKGTDRRTLRNLYDLELLKVATNAFIEAYPLQLSKAGAKLLEQYNLNVGGGDITDSDQNQPASLVDETAHTNL